MKRKELTVKQLPPTEKAECVEFNGLVYRRYPNAKKRDDRVYYRCGSNWIKKGFGYLHRDIWRHYFGEIPRGFHIHHKDENPDNNTIENYELLSAEEHFKKHPTLLEEIPILRKRMAHARQFADKWHSSDEGRKWHSEHGKRSYAKREFVTKTCSMCSSAYETRNRNPRDKFCSQSCRARFRRKSKVDNVMLPCLECGQLFSKNRYSKSVSCSLSCAAKRRERLKR